MADFADRIKLFRTMHGFNQDDVALRLRTTKQKISLYENRQLFPKCNQILGMAKDLGVDVLWLMGIDGAIVFDEENEIELCEVVKKMEKDQIDLLLALAKQIIKTENRAIS